MARTSRVFQFTPDPAEGLLGQRFNIIITSVLKQLCQCRGQEFSSPSIRIGFEPMPFTITDAEVLMQSQGLLD